MLKIAKVPLCCFNMTVWKENAGYKHKMMYVTSKNKKKLGSSAVVLQQECFGPKHIPGWLSFPARPGKAAGRECADSVLIEIAVSRRWRFL